ncbi:hypothetical protein DRN50_05590 [Thermococci archaeon]|nr:MAG: hypothetical protein DRN50_05590 [Thermococci archaeon]
MSIKLRVIDDDERGKWDTLVAASPHGTLFHTWKWLKVMEKHTMSKFYPLMGLKRTTPVGVFPLFYQKRFLVRTVFSPPPSTAVHHLGPLLVDYNRLKQDRKESIFTEFQREVDRFMVSDLKADYIWIGLPPGLLDARPFKWTGYQIEPAYDYLIDLSRGADYVWQQFKKNLRQNISRAEKRGISVETGSKRELEMIYDSLSKRYREQDTTLSLPESYLLDLYDLFYPENMKIFVAKYNGDYVGGLIDLYYKDKVVSWLGNVKASVECVSPNDLLQWEAIRYAIEHGMKCYEEMGANTERLCKYKSKYNPDPSIRFSAKKYSSVMLRLGETAYHRVWKPINRRLKFSE